jgi:ABC-type glycerol-3-phosphate transport system permease component
VVAGPRLLHDPVLHLAVDGLLQDRATRRFEEAAIVDGCSLFGGLLKMVLPLSLPAILTVVIFAFALTLQEFVMERICCAPPGPVAAALR